MKVIRGEVGFCFGVQRAVDILVRASSRYGRIVTLGPIVHNSHVVSQLAARGIISGTIDDLLEASSTSPIPRGDVLAITAHGASPAVYREAYEKGIALIDTTCPTVRRAQRVVESLAQRDIPVIIFGDPNHTEVKALTARSKDALVAEEPVKLNRCWRDVHLVSQTTKSFDKYVPFFEGIKALNPGVNFYYHDTTCREVSKRIAKAKEVCRSVELMLVVGDRMSANTKNLLSICSGLVEAHQIETRDGIDKNWLENKEIIGITSGTSTPMHIIDAVEKYLEESGGGTNGGVRNGKTASFTGGP